MSMKIGAGWLKTSQKGTQYVNLHFEIEAAGIIAAGNCFITMCGVQNKVNPEAPDYSVLATAKDENRTQNR